MESRKICILGSANADIFVYVHHIPQPGETIQAVNQLFSNGGKGANQAAAAARLLGHSLFLGQVGNDKEMLRIKKEMSESGVELGWSVLEDSTTGQAFIFVDQAGENSIVIVGGANVAYQSLA